MSFGKKKSVFGAAPKRSDASKPHREVLALVQQLYGGFTILEEQTIECYVSGNNKPQRLPVDIVIKDLRVAIEVQGRQHFEFVEFFHNDNKGFKAQQERDAAKAKAIRDHGWAYLAINEEEVTRLTIKSLTKLITKAMKEIP